MATYPTVLLIKIHHLHDDDHGGRGEDPHYPHGHPHHAHGHDRYHHVRGNDHPNGHVFISVRNSTTHDGGGAHDGHVTIRSDLFRVTVCSPPSYRLRTADGLWAFLNAPLSVRSLLGPVVPTRRLITFSCGK